MFHSTITIIYQSCFIGGGVTSVYVLSFLDYETTDVFFGKLADIDGFGRTLADSDGHWGTRTDNGGLGRTLADSDGLVLQGKACLPRLHNKGQGEPLSQKSCAKNSLNNCPPISTDVLSFLNSMRQRMCFLGH